MRITLHRSILTAIILATATVCSATSGNARSWTVCNRTADKITVAIAYPSGGTYVSEGWWTLNPCGGCATVLNANLDATGVFLRGEAQGVGRYQGDTLHCVRRQAFTIKDSSIPGSRCRSRSGTLAQFQLVVLTGDRYTTNLTGRSASGRVCID